MAHSLLLIPVPEVEFVVRPRLARLSPERLPPEPGETTAHITLLGPFAELGSIGHGLVSELEDFFADVVPFPFALTSIRELPGAVTYLVPEPTTPFRRLTLELTKRFPEFPPYRGEFDAVVPHLSVPVSDDASVYMLRFELEPRLPITAHAREAALYWSEPHACRTLETFTFGTTAA